MEIVRLLLLERRKGSMSTFHLDHRFAWPGPRMQEQRATGVDTGPKAIDSDRGPVLSPEKVTCA